MSLKAAFKPFIVGPPGLRPRTMKWGLLRGLAFHVDTATQSQRLVGLAEAEIVQSLRRLATLAQSALDIGANDGWYSLYLASRPNIKRILAFDPSSEAISQLRGNFALNEPAFAAKLTCYEKFIGDSDTDSTCTVDSVARDLPRPVLLKVDVDGGELDVLRGARQLLASGDALLVVETHSRELEDDCIALLAEHGYEPKVIPNGWYRLVIPERRPIAHNRWLVACRS
jgi:hypothetical protein